MAFPNLSDIVTRVRSELREATAALWTDAELKRWINDAQRDIAIKTLCIDAVKSVATVASSRLVLVSGIKIKAMEYLPTSGTKISLQKIMPYQMGRLPGAAAGAVIPAYWFPFGSYAVIDPLPDIAYNLNAYVADWPSYEMYDNADDPVVPAEFFTDIVDYAQAMALMKKKKWGTAVSIHQSYIQRLQVKRDKYIEPVVNAYASLNDVPDIIQIAQEERA